MATRKCPIKRTPDIIDCNLKKDDQILIIFGTNINIPHTTGDQMTIQVPSPSSLCSSTNSGNQNKQNIAFLLEVVCLFN